MMVSYMKIRLNTSIRELIVYKRKEFNLSQKDLANKIGISQQRLQRIESGINKCCEREILRKICDELGINWGCIISEENIHKNFRLPNELVVQIKTLQKQKHFSSETEALIYILEEYFNDQKFKSIRYEMEELLEDVVVKTFIKEMKKMGRDIEKYQKVLEMIESKEGVNTLRYLNDYEERLYKKIHAERM